MSSNENVVPFRVITSATPTPTPTEAPLSDASPEQREFLESLAGLMKFLMDNKMAMRGFVCGITLDNPNGIGGDTITHSFTSPIEARDYALLLKVLENQFFKNLNG
jgi:hypothetical protein